MGRCAARDALVSAPVSDANLVVGAFAAMSVGRPAAEALALLALVTGQDVEPVDGSGWHRRAVADRMTGRGRQS